MIDIRSALTSEKSSWFPIGNVERDLTQAGVSIETLKRHNASDGTFHKQFSYQDKSLELYANRWVAESFKPLVD